MRRRLPLVALVVVVALGGGCGGDGDDLPPARRLCDLGRDNDQGVVGHDLAASTRLSDGRALFVFGDTLLGRLDGDERRTAGLVNSSGALLPAGTGICDAPLEYLTDGRGRVRALLPPPGERGTVRWPVDAAVVDGRVWMLYRWVERTGDGPLELRVRGTGLAVADEDDLRFTLVDPLLVEGDRPLPTAVIEDDGELVALVCDGGDEPDPRCRLRAVDTGAGALGPALDVPPVDLASSEMSLDRLPVDQDLRWRVSTMPDLGCALQVAVVIGGSWARRTVLEPDLAEGHLCYAGRIQEPFSTAGELVATWVDSGGDSADADTYWPHVEAIDLTGG